MPNWCFNKLTVKGALKDVVRFRDAAKGKSLRDGIKVVPLSFASHVPVPEGEEHRPYWGTNTDVNDDDTNFSEKLGKKKGRLTYTFDTGWSPPSYWLLKVGALYPTLDLVLSFEEPGCAIWGKTQSIHGVTDDINMTQEEYLIEFDEEYTRCLKKIRKMPQAKLIKCFSCIGNFNDYIEDCDEGSGGKSPGFYIGTGYYRIAGTIIEAIEPQYLPLYINVDWGSDDFNQMFRERLSNNQ